MTPYQITKRVNRLSKELCKAAVEKETNSMSLGNFVEIVPFLGRNNWANKKYCGGGRYGVHQTDVAQCVASVGVELIWEDLKRLRHKHPDMILDDRDNIIKMPDQLILEHGKSFLQKAIEVQPATAITAAIALVALAIAIFK